MQPGAYVLCRPIEDGPARHQFLVLVPAKPTSLAGFTQAVDGKLLCVMGAYDIAGFLRASLFAASDVGFLRRKLATPLVETVQSSKVELQACLTGSEDPFLECMARCFSRYRSFEGSKHEIKYPALAAQLNSGNFNSNSWAQSLLFWAQMLFVPGKAIRDFEGLDVGNDRLISKNYFVP